MSAWPIGTVVSVAVGSIFILGGLIAVVRGFADARSVARVVGDEYMLAADAATFTVGRTAVRIKEYKRESLIFLLAALAVFMKALWDHNISLTWIIGLLAGIGLFRISRQMLPATLLVLSESSQGTLDLQARLNKSIGPYRAVSLLRVDRREEIHVRSNCFRVGPGEDWTAAVKAFCGLLPLIILDYRSRTRYVEEEISIVLPQYRFKTIFVIDAKGREGLVRRAREMDPADSANDIVSVAENTECARLVGELLLRLKVVPTRKLPLAGLLANDPGAKERQR